MLTPQQIQDIKSTVQSSGSAVMTPDQAKASFMSVPSGSSQDSGIFSKFGSDIQDAGQRVNSAISGTGDYSGQSVTNRVTGAVSEAAGGVTRAASDLIPDPVKNAIGYIAKNALPLQDQLTSKVADANGGVINWLGQALGSTKLAQDFVTKHPDATKTIEDYARTGQNLGNTAGTILAAGGVAEGGNALVEKAGEISAGAVDSLSKTPLASPEIQAQQTAKLSEDLRRSGIKDATPNYSDKLVGDQSLRGQIRESKGLGTRTIEPTSDMVSSGQELAKTEGYSDLVNSKATNLQKAQFVDGAIAKKGIALDASLANEKILRPPQELNSIIKTAVTDAADKSQLLSKSDPMVKNYLRSAKRIIDATDGTLAGERKIVLKLDQAYEDSGGKYANNKPLDQLHRAARQSLINDMEAKAQNTEVKASLKEMRNLYNANDVLWDKAKTEGGSALLRLMKAHPVLTKVVGKVGNMAGLGGVIDLAH